MDVDPAASLRCWAAEIELGGRTFEVPALPAADWWPVLVSGDLSKILDFVVSTPGPDVDDLILTGQVGAGELQTALTDTIEEMAGRSLHVATVLAEFAQLAWPAIGGSLATRGFRWDVMPLGAALDAVYATIVGSLGEEHRTKFLALLENEALSQPGKRKAVSQRAMTEFETMAGPRPTTGVRSTGAPSDSARPKTRTRPRPPHPDDPSDGPTRRPVLLGRNGPAASP